MKKGPFQGRRVEKPWGHELIWAHTDRYVGKILHIEPGEALSLQYHERKDETLYLLSGKLRLQVGDSEASLREVKLKPGDSVHMPAGRLHRMVAVDACDVLEASTPELDDVVRLTDNYGRVPNPKRATGKSAAPGGKSAAPGRVRTTKSRTGARP